MSTPAANSLIQNVRAERAAIRELALQAERERRLPAALVERMTTMGLFRILQPRAYGGLELGIIDALDVIEEVSSVDGAAGWCLLKGASSNQMAGYLPPEAAREVWSHPQVIVAGNFNPTKGRAVRAEGGYRLSGRWDWGTGSTHSQWLIGGAMVFESAAAAAPMLGPNKVPVIKALLFPAQSARLHDTWHSHGMRGTGSGDFDVTDLWVPEAFAFDGLMALPQIESPLYAVPYMAQVPLPHAALAVGIARGALEDFKALASTKTPLMTQALLKDREIVQSIYGGAVAEVDASRAYVQAVAREAWAVAGGQAPIETLSTRLSLACAHATARCVQAVDAVYRLAGSSAVFESSPIQRALRDIHVAASHFLVNADKQAAAGKRLLS